MEDPIILYNCGHTNYMGVAFSFNNTVMYIESIRHSHHIADDAQSVEHDQRSIILCSSVQPIVLPDPE